MKAVTEIVIKATDEHIDLCAACVEQIRELLADRDDEPTAEAPKRRGRPPKISAPDSPVLNSAPAE